VATRGWNHGGPIFRAIKKGGSVTLERLSDRSVAQIVKRRAEAAGFDPTVFSGHSLRAGFVTSALHHGADILRVMDVTRHREVSTLKTYDRRAKAFKQHAGEAFL
jgi:site-specific recombinase XerD